MSQPRAPDGALPEPPATMLTSHDVPAPSLRREGPWAGASYARRVGSVSENQDLLPAQGRMPGLRRADAPAHGPDPPTTQGRGERRDQPQRTRSRQRTEPTTPVGAPPNRRRQPAPDNKQLTRSRPCPRI
ncbi:hypothetical protein GCM10023080_003640 [Streptomyces pseudoechinosporeus]